MGHFDDKPSGGASPGAEEARLRKNLIAAEGLVGMWAWRSVIDDTCVEEEWAGCDLRLRRRARKFEIMASFYKRGRFGEERFDDAVARLGAMGPASGIEKLVVAVLRCYLAIDSRGEARTKTWFPLANQALDLARQHAPKFAVAFQKLCASLWDEFNRTGRFENDGEFHLGDELLFAFLEMPAGFAIDPTFRPQILPSSRAPEPPAPAAEDAAPTMNPAQARVIELLLFLHDNIYFWSGQPDSPADVAAREQAVLAASNVILAHPIDPPLSWLQAAFGAVASTLPRSERADPSVFPNLSGLRSIVGKTFDDLARQYGVASPVDWSQR